MAFHWDVFVVQLATFAVGMYFIWLLYLKPLGRHLKQRREGIEKDLGDAEQARADAEKLTERVSQERDKLEEQGRAILDKAKADAEALREQNLIRAQKEQEAAVEQARRQIEQDKEAALREIRHESAALIMDATEKLLGKNLDRKKQEKLVQQFIKDL